MLQSRSPSSPAGRALWAALFLSAMLIATSLGSPCARAAIVVSDGAFQPQDWDLTIFYTEGNGGTVTGVQSPTGGNPGAYRQIQVTVNAAPPYSMVLSFQRYTPFVYDPAVSGQIFSIDYSEDAIMISGAGDGQGAAPAIRQNGEVFVGPIFGTPDTHWTHHSYLTLLASDFSQWPSDPGHHPDFSAGGAPIEFGFFRGNSTRAGGYTIIGGIDNWTFSLSAGDVPPVGACCLNDGSCENMTAADCRAANGSYQGDATDCGTTTCTPRRACCFADGSCLVLPQADCGAQGGVWQAVNTCSPNPCTYSGACCLDDGSCRLLSQSQCILVGGIFDVSPECEPNPCTRPLGNCCMCDGDCVVVSESTCRAMSGTFWETPATGCNPDPCNPQPGACCLPDGSCIQTLDCICTFSHGVFHGPQSVCDVGACTGTIDGLTWDAEEVVDTGVLTVSGSAGPCAAHTPNWAPWAGRDEWHVVYAKGTQVYERVHTPSGWQPPTRVTSDVAIAGNPKLAFAGGVLIVVWEDTRTGPPEIWSRQWDGTSWSPEMALSTDGLSSWGPVIAGTDQGALVVWQEEAAYTYLSSRSWDNGVWGPVTGLASGLGPMLEPTLSTLWHDYYLAWADYRHGSPEIYLKVRQEGGAWMPDRRLTELPGGCRHPSIFADTCCNDMIRPVAFVAFENDWTGVPESWLVTATPDENPIASRISPNDGIASERPSIGGYSSSMEGLFYSDNPNLFVTWTDRGGVTGWINRLAFVPYVPDQFFVDRITTLTLTGRSISGVAAFPGTCYAGDPWTRVMSLYLEMRGGVLSLVSKRGHILGAWRPDYEVPAAILIGPEGIPSNTIRILNDCPGGGPLPGVTVGLRFSHDLEGRLVWDETQPHPNIPEKVTDSLGEAVFPIRGGGCAQVGTVCVTVDGVEARCVTGAKSPDVDGNCIVQQDDLDYVQSKVGTSDFCADLDGSGLVDAADVAIVQATLGDMCTQAMDVDGSSTTGPLDLAVSPNPVQSSAMLRLRSPLGASVSLRIFDAAGRAVRNLGTVPRGGPISWDGRDDAGHPLSSGVYFVRAHSRGSSGVQEIRRTIVIIR